jgi:hypothetical protein
MAGAKQNDSLDMMRNEFMADYQNIIRESGETFFNIDHPHLSAQRISQKNDIVNGLSNYRSKTESKGGPLSQMLAAGAQFNKQ